MKATVENMRVIGKSMREGDNERGHWVLYELELANGEGASVTLTCEQDIYEEIEPFKPCTGEIELYRRGYQIRGEVVAVWPE